MRTSIIGNIIQNAGSIDNLIALQRIGEDDGDYKERIYTTAHDLFMKSVETLGLDSLGDDDEAPYDAIREDTIFEIVDMLMYGITPDGF